MLSEKLSRAINAQINHELYSGYLYLSMAAYFDGESLPGFAHWMRAQAAEEQEHALKFYDYVYERGGTVTLAAIDGPPTEFASPLAVFEQTLAHERKVTGLINDLYALAVEDKDYASQVFLQWFISEQVEEEDNATQIIDTLKRVGEKGQALVMLDRELGRRGAD
jgi:ferritin